MMEGFMRDPWEGEGRGAKERERVCSLKCDVCIVVYIQNS